VSARRGTRNTKKRESVVTSTGSISGGRLPSDVTVLAIEQALAELGVQARLSDIVAKASLIGSEIIQSRPRRKQEHVC
jgi:hypothetical protein